MSKGFTEVTIFGHTYKLKASAGEEHHIKMLASFIDEKMDAFFKKNPHFKPINLAVLTALNLADELFKLKESESFSSQYNDFSDRISRLIDKLDKFV